MHRDYYPAAICFPLVEFTIIHLTHSLLCSNFRGSPRIQQTQAATVSAEYSPYYSEEFVIGFEAIIHAFLQKLFGFGHNP